MHTTTTKQKAGNNWQLGEVASAYILVVSQATKDSVLFGYYTCELLRGDLCYFIHCKCSHKDGLFFDLRRQPRDD
uniref:Uncharacterized protein n=1 Tax=Oryza glumipatula TaxID=40148 RepID=A0A0E0BQA9_9ORYZ